MVCDRIAPDENVSRPSWTPRDASSIIRIDRFEPISAMTRRIALAPMSSTATSSGVDADLSALAAEVAGAPGECVGCASLTDGVAACEVSWLSFRKGFTKRATRGEVS